MTRIKIYENIEDLRRDLNQLDNQIDESLMNLDKLTQLYALASALAPNTAAVRVRGQNPSVVKTADSLTTLLKSQKLSSTYSTLNKLQDYLDVLQNMEEQAKNGLKSLKGADKLIADLARRKREVEKGILEAHKVVGEFAKRNFPPIFSRAVKRLALSLEEALSGKYRKMTLVNQIAPVDGNIHFGAYFAFDHLEDDNGYVHPRAYLVVTMVMSVAGQSTFHVNYQPGLMRLPGRFKLSPPIDDLTDLEKAAKTILAEDKFNSILTPRKLPVTRKSIQFTNAYIQKTVIKDHTIFVLLKREIRTKERALEIMLQLWKDLKSIIVSQHPREKSVIKYHLRQKLDKWVIQFTFHVPTGYEGHSLSPYDWKTMREKLNLNEDEMLKVQRALDK